MSLDVWRSGGALALDGCATTLQVGSTPNGVSLDVWGAGGVLALDGFTTAHWGAVVLST